MQIISSKPATSFGAHLLIQSFHKYLWSAYHVPRVVLIILSVSKTCFSSLGAHILVGIRKVKNLMRNFQQAMSKRKLENEL